MLFSIALVGILGVFFGEIMQRLKMPRLLGMMFAGIMLGPYGLNQIDPAILGISAELRQMALIVILIRAGLALDTSDLKKAGRPAMLLCFLPATFELAAVTLLAPALLGITYLEAAIMGAVLAAVSPAVVVPRMLKLMENGYGQDKQIPQLIMAGAAVDDIYVIILFSSFTGMYEGEGFHIGTLASLPASIFLGLLAGGMAGVLAVWLTRKFHIPDTRKILLFLCLSFLLVSLEEAAKPYVPVSGLLAVMVMGAAMRKKNAELANRLSKGYEKIWVWAELMLFVLVGAAVNIEHALSAGFPVMCLILIALIFRMAGVFTCLIKTNLNKKERLYAAISYLPKATVQAAIGGIPLSMGIPAGSSILTAAALAIIITAPVGAIGMDLTYKRLLRHWDG